MCKRRLFLSLLTMCLTLTSNASNALSDWSFDLNNLNFQVQPILPLDLYPNREVLLSNATAFCQKMKNEMRPARGELYTEFRKTFPFQQSSLQLSYESEGWTADYTLQGQSPKDQGAVRILKNGKYISFSYRQNQNEIESIAAASFDEKCLMSEARFTFFNSALRPVRKMKMNEKHEIIMSVIMEEPVQNPYLDLTNPNTVRIGVIDSGLDFNHSELEKKTRPMLGIDLTNLERPPYDYTNTFHNELMGKHFTHGTAVAEIASRNMDALVIPVRIANQSQLAAEAVEYLAKQNVRIVNISQGGYKENDWLSLRQAIRQHPEILFVVAAGNESEDIDAHPTFPASLEEPNLITVTSVNNQGELSSFSNYGAKHVHFAALGEDVRAAHAGGGYWTVNGSSFAAPLVVNIAARILQNHPQMTMRELREALVQKSIPNQKLKNKMKYGVLLLE